MLPTSPQWGPADAEIKTAYVETLELYKILCLEQVRTHSHACIAYCQDFRSF